MLLQTAFYNESEIIYFKLIEKYNFELEIVGLEPARVFTAAMSYLTVSGFLCLCPFSALLEWPLWHK